MYVSLIFSSNFAGEITRRDRPQSSLFPPVLIYKFRRVPYHWLKIPSHPISFSLIQVDPSFSLVDRIDNDTLCKNLILIQRCPEELEIFLTDFYLKRRETVFPPSHRYIPILGKANLVSMPGKIHNLSAKDTQLQTRD